MSGTAIPIGIAVVEHGGAYLIGKRGPDGPLPNVDEFPGGKCRAGEAPRECAERECLEETGVAVEARELLLNSRFSYSHGVVDLHFWLCGLEDKTTSATVRAPFRWVPLRNLRELQFPPANTAIVELLTSRRSLRD